MAYDPTDDARKSYDAAIEAKRLRGDTHDWEGHQSNRRSHMDKVYATNSTLLASLATAQVSPASCFTRLDESISQLRNIRNRVSALADMLTGSIPEGASSGETNCCGGGRFDQIDLAASDINELCSHIASSLTRIENRL